MVVAAFPFAHTPRRPRPHPLAPLLPSPPSLPSSLRYEAWKNRQSKAHPLYATASSEYGKVPRGVQHEIQPPAHGKGGGFSSTFAGGGATRSSGLTTAVTKHRFMKDLDPM